MKKFIQFFSLFLTFTYSLDSSAAVSTDVICSYAPSQSAAINKIAGFAGGSSAGAEITLFANGLTILPHSSGGLIMAGSGGYIAGTMTGSVITTTLVTAGLVVAGTAITVELACVPKNHPDLIAKLKGEASTYPDSANDLLNSAAASIKPISKTKLQEITDTFKKYKTITKDKFYALLGETWYERAIRKTKEAFTD
jgi:hypothetical protein